MDWNRRGLDIVARLKKAHPELADDAKVGLVSSFCKGSRVESNGGPPEIVATLTTDDMDLDGERLIPGGIDFDSYFLKNRNYFCDHEYDMAHVVGKVRSLKVGAAGVLVRVAMVNPDSPMTRACVALAEAGAIGSSIGFTLPQYSEPTADEAKRWGKAVSIVRRCVAIEGSFTAMPCNVACQSQGVVYPDEEKAAQAREVLVKARIPASVIKAMLPEDPPPATQRRRVIVCAGGV